VQDLTRKLFTFRKNSAVLTEGNTLHFAPMEGVYVLSRYTSDKRVTLFINKAERSVDLDLNAYHELSLQKGQTAVDVIDNKTFTVSETIHLAPRSFLLIESSHEND